MTPDESMIQEMLVTSVACGDAGLVALLESQALIVWALAAGCHADVRYLKAQLGLIELAQGYTRNQIDRSNSRSETYGEDVSDGSSYRDSSSERSSAYRKCGWSQATNWQQFVRDSEQHDRSRADSVSASSAWSDATSSDRSRQVAQGWATSYDDMLATGTALALSVASARDDRTSAASSGTPGWDGSGNIDTGSISISVTAPTFSISLVPFDINITPPTVNISDSIESGYSNPGPHQPFCGDEDEPCESLASMARGWQANYNLSASIPTVGALRVDWSKGKNFRQSFVCSGGRTTGDGQSSSNSTANSLDVSNAEAEALSHDESMRQQAVQRSGDSARDSESNSTNYARGVMRSLGQTDSGADSTNHNEQTATGTGAAASTNHAESLGTGYSDTVGTQDANYWSQIFASLQDMWQRVLAEILAFERIHAATTGPCAGVICATLGRGAPVIMTHSGYLSVRPRGAKPLGWRSGGCTITELPC